MSWQYYYNDETDETTYYHDGEEVTTLSGGETVWRNGMPYDNHLGGIKDAFQEADTSDRIAMIYDLHLGFEGLDDPLDSQ